MKIQNIIWVNREYTKENPFFSIAVTDPLTDKQNQKVYEFKIKMGKMIDKLEKELSPQA